MPNRIIHQISSETNIAHTSNPKFVKYAIAWDDAETEETAEETEKKVYELLRSDINGNFENWTVIKLCSKAQDAREEARKDCQKELEWNNKE